MEFRHLRYFIRVAETLASLSIQFAASANPRFQFQERSQLFIRSHNETLSVTAMGSAIQIVCPAESTAAVRRFY